VTGNVGGYASDGGLVNRVRQVVSKAFGCGGGKREAKWR
jgi:hypothetical protein